MNCKYFVTNQQGVSSRSEFGLNRGVGDLADRDITSCKSQGGQIVYNEESGQRLTCYRARNKKRASNGSLLATTISKIQYYFARAALSIEGAISFSTADPSVPLT